VKYGRAYQRREQEKSNTGADGHDFPSQGRRSSYS
jgi:hypothetical protein